MDDFFSQCYTDSQGQSGLDFGIHMNLNFLDAPVYYFIFNYSGTFSIADISGGLDGPEFRKFHFYVWNLNNLLDDEAPQI